MTATPLKDHLFTEILSASVLAEGLRDEITQSWLGGELHDVVYRRLQPGEFPVLRIIL